MQLKALGGSSSSPHNPTLPGPGLVGSRPGPGFGSKQNNPARAACHTGRSRAGPNGLWAMAGRCLGADETAGPGGVRWAGSFDFLVRVVERVGGCPIWLAVCKNKNAQTQKRKKRLVPVFALDFPS